VLPLADLAIELTEREKSLVSQIDFDPVPTSHNADSWQPIADAIVALMHSLLERDAIPPARWSFFTNPNCFVGGNGRSHRKTFENNGRRGDDIYRDVNFVRYLRYFLYGAKLEKPVTDAFQQKATTGITASYELADFARKLTREHQLEPHRAAEEFYKLALDCGLDTHDARSVRDRVKKTR
jgi:hypothetical protein